MPCVFLSRPSSVLPCSSRHAYPAQPFPQSVSKFLVCPRGPHLCFSDCSFFSIFPKLVQQSDRNCPWKVCQYSSCCKIWQKNRATSEVRETLHVDQNSFLKLTKISVKPSKIDERSRARRGAAQLETPGPIPAGR